MSPTVPPTSEITTSADDDSAVMRAMIVGVHPLAGFDKVLHYRVPEAMRGALVVGSLVRVPIVNIGRAALLKIMNMIAAAGRIHRRRAVAVPGLVDCNQAVPGQEGQHLVGHVVVALYLVHYLRLRDAFLSGKQGAYLLGGVLHVLRRLLLRGVPHRLPEAEQRRARPPGRRDLAVPSLRRSGRSAAPLTRGGTRRGDDRPRAAGPQHHDDGFAPGAVAGAGPLFDDPALAARQLARGRAAVAGHRAAVHQDADRRDFHHGPGAHTRQPHLEHGDLHRERAVDVHRHARQLPARLQAAQGEDDLLGALEREEGVVGKRAPSPYPASDPGTPKTWWRSFSIWSRMRAASSNSRLRAWRYISASSFLMRSAMS